MAWQDKIGGCFGNADVEFATHPSDEKRAKELIAEAKAAGATREDFEKEMVWHIYKKVTAEGLLQPHIANQMKNCTECGSDRQPRIWPSCARLAT
jgi:hypothetical protein